MRAPFWVACGGNVSVITALFGVAAIGFTGFAVDVGSVYLQTRKLQGIADLAAIAAASNPTYARAAAAYTINTNGWREPVDIELTPGAYSPDRTIPSNQRFMPGAGTLNAARVRLVSKAQLFFGRVFLPSGEMTISRTATAARTRWASFQIGSRLLQLKGGIANDTLSALTGSTVNLSVMDYNALASADVDLFEYMGALRTRMDMQVATFGDTLNTRVEADNAIGAIADTLVDDRRAATAINRIAAAAGSKRFDGMRRLIDLGPYQSATEPTAQHTGSTGFRVNALQLAAAIAQIAGGDRQVRLQLAGGLPGLADTQAWLAIGERPNNSPWLTVTDNDEVVIRTAQMRLYVETSAGLSGALAPLGSVHIPVLLELASAQAKLNDITCGTDARSRSVTLDVAPSIGSLSLGEVNTGQLDNFRTELSPAPAQHVRAGLVRIEGDAHVTLGGARWQSVRFSGTDIENGVTRTVSTSDAAQATFSSLLRQTHVTVRAGGLGLGTSLLSSGTLNALEAAGAPLDDLLNSLSAVLGVRLGQADVRVNGVRCGGAALVA